MEEHQVTIAGKSLDIRESVLPTYYWGKELYEGYYGQVGLFQF